MSSRLMPPLPRALVQAERAERERQEREKKAKQKQKAKDKLRRWGVPEGRYGCSRRCGRFVVGPPVQGRARPGQARPGPCRPLSSMARFSF